MLSVTDPDRDANESFGVRHGFEQGKLRDRRMDSRLKNALWSVFYKHWPYDDAARAAIWTDWAGMALDELEAQVRKDLQGKIERMEFLEPYEAAGVSPLEADGVLARLKEIYFKVPEGEHYRIYELVELACGGLEETGREKFEASINQALARNGSVYRLANSRLGHTVPKLEHDAIEEASGISSASRRHVEMARRHMELTSPNYEASIAESIKAVEHTAQDLGGKGNGLNSMVSGLSGRLGLHPAMQEQFSHVYKFANKTSRHSEPGEAYRPDSSDAKAMLVWCSAMANYLVDKAAGVRASAGGAASSTKGGSPGPKSPVGLVTRGHALLARGRQAKAVEAFERAAREDPRSADAHHGRGRAMSVGGHHPEALEAYERAIALEKRHFMAHLDKGTALVLMGRHKEAIAAFGEACAIKPRNAEAHLKRAKALHDIERHGEALKSCRRAIELDPDNPDVHGTKASILRSLKLHEDALESINRAIALDRNNARLHVDKGHILDALGRISEGIAAYHLAIKLDPAMRELVPQP